MTKKELTTSFFPCVTKKIICFLVISFYFNSEFNVMMALVFDSIMVFEYSFSLIASFVVSIIFLLAGLKIKSDFKKKCNQSK